jgi:serine/threonine protein kinase/tetratricopeptide (TPR) repeat protein
MSPVDTEHNLLLGLLALQNGLIDQAQLVAAFQSWTRDKGRPLADHLVGLGYLDRAHCPLLEGLAALHLARHGGDAQRSLAAIPAGRSTRESLARIGDPDLGATLGGVGSRSKEHDDDGAADRTTSYSAGAATGDGQRFRVLRPHARGGLGAVFVALDGELNREVALKQILDGHADDPASRSRFLLEAEITGGLEHPGVVPVYGLGTYGDGRPYYAMRFIRGDSLKEAIETFRRDATLKRGSGRHSLGLRGLLRRFVDVCNAIDYAHGRGVIHRDIKPANVVLGKHGETLVVDWGLAKLLGGQEPGQGAGERTLRPCSASGSAETLPGSALGTPAYMSPEQAAGDLDRLGPRSDVYSLGATLYCILTGRPPFEGDDLGAVLRAVRSAIFPRPREIDPSVDPALESVCLKAMAVKPEDRYESSRALAEEIERWSADQPVSAHRDSALVRAGRWARKHRVGVAIGAGVLQTAVVALAISTILLGQSRARVDRERRRAEAVNAFLVRDLLAQADPNNNSAGPGLTVRELLDRAARSLDASPAMRDNPAVEGPVRSLIGSTYFGLGLYRPSLEQLERAVACEDRAPEVPAAERIFTRNRLAWTLYKMGRLNDGFMMAMATRMKARAALGPDHEETVYAADSVAAMTVNANRTAALGTYRENLAIQRRVLGPGHPLTLLAANNLVSALSRYASGDDPKNVAEALRVARDAREAALRSVGPDHLQTLRAGELLGFALVRQGKFAEAHAVLGPVRERALRILGPGHLDAATYAETLALAEEGLGHLEAAEALLTEAYTLRHGNLSEGHSQTLQVRWHLARVSLALGKTRAAATHSWDILRFYQYLWRKTGSEERVPGRTGTGAVEALEQVFAGRAGPTTCGDLLGPLEVSLRGLAWEKDWFRNHVSCLEGEVRCQTGPTSADPAAGLHVGRVMIESGVRLLESNPSTPRRILEEDRSRLERYRAAPTPPATAGPL